ncbi:MAG: cation transporter [Chloroflexota bacterium]|nr:cation transporter [Chloroflexota bacterium]
MNRWLYVLLLAVPAAVLAEPLHAPPLISFVLASLGLIPLAGLIALSTETLVERLGHRVGGLLNATFGNAAEIIIGLTGLAAGLPEVVRASLAGSIIGNVLLVLGSSMLIGGWRHLRQEFDPRAAGQYAAMLALVVISMGIPSLLATVGEGNHPGAAVVRGSELYLLSIGIALILLLCYAAYIAHSVFGLRAFKDTLTVPAPADEHDESGHHAPLPGGVLTENTFARSQARPAGFPATFAIWWRTVLWLPIAVLAGVTAVTAVVSEVLVSTIEPVAHQVGLNPFFVGLIILPIVGNAASGSLHLDAHTLKEAAA